MIGKRSPVAHVKVPAASHTVTAIGPRSHRPRAGGLMLLLWQETGQCRRLDCCIFKNLFVVAQKSLPSAIFLSTTCSLCLNLNPHYDPIAVAIFRTIKSPCRLQTYFSCPVGRHCPELNQRGMAR